ncbi:MULTISPECIES: MoxR family ATPase [Curtobacterium]|uniref:AAA family ATPase n=1 Tax=Curtobacterium TaxID=2034 RepID=UPI000FBFB51C|nr:MULTISPECIES: MoxR family ATPase [Curtobacterium]ROQ04800.1 MoxR-like ATPase [Curtobacterium sp. PhB171]ROQ28250.1 MoxR-like ATPase [Curtobacterium sp. PhB170]ROS33218.1 MoxR-like ATPase [Curtobacterium sp. PhB131]ROS47218.1 MoxR-like ATPase [Curtobacterium sp. PhB78]ROS58443.1 MoxR-like ATPase [Curtobacterium sp. PhB172]
MPEPTDPAFPLERIREVGDAIVASVSTVIDGKTEAIRTALTVMLAEGHLLVEDVPGVGKTVLAKALGASVGGSVNRIQFTSDMLPSDVTGVNIFDQSSGTFRFSPGPVFANVVIGDEINRTSPKTQSALLEAMAESQVTVDGVTRLLDRPFMIVATQNPIDMEGTYPLPEAQRDRFMARITMGYPSVDAERQMLANRGGGDPLSHLRPIVDVTTLRGIIEAVANVHIAPDVEAYVIAIVRSTRTHPDLVLGASPRATLHLAQAARAHAALLGRPFVTPDDVAALAPIVLAHRLVPVARGLGGTGEDTVREIVVRIVSDTAVPFTATPVRS